MKAVVCHELGMADKLRVEDVPIPKPGKGEVLIKVSTAGINFPDVLIIQGKYQVQPPLPFIPGGEGAGVIEELGEGVEGYTVGQSVIFFHQTGAFAEYITVPVAGLTPMPKGMPFEHASGFTITNATTYHAFKQRANLQPGETVLVLGAAGGVGTAAISIAKAMGAKVIAAASTDDKLEMCRSLGADETINYSTEDMKSRLKEITGGKGIDVVYDPVGGDYTEVALRAMAPGGRLLVIGFAAGDIPKPPLNLCLLKQCAIVGVFWGAWARANPAGQQQNMKELFELYGEGKVPVAYMPFALDDYEEAYACLTERRAKGKVIFKM